jgi:undecaprenyl-diphosphatase
MWLISLALTILFLLERRYTDALLFTISVVGSSLLNAGVKWIVKRPRPFVVPHLAYVSNASFPSGHAMLSATVYLTLAALTAHTLPGHALRSYVVGVTIFIVLLIGCSRIYLGVHWPSDVLAGWCLGAAWALAFTLVAALTPQAAPKTALQAVGRAGASVPSAIAGATGRAPAPAPGKAATAP